MKTTPGDRIRQEFTFTAVPDGALHDKRVTRQAFMVYVVLCHHADRRGGNAFPGLNTIAREARCGKTSVVKAIQDLVGLGYVKKEKRTVPGKQEFNANLYTITAKIGSPVQDYGSPTQDYVGSPVQDPNYIPSSYLDPLNHSEPALHGNALGNGGGKATEYPAVFEIWWAAYPRKTEKRAAFAKWKATLKKGVSKADLLTAAQSYAAACAADGRESQYIKHPATFLGPAEPWRDYLNGNGHGAGESAEQAAAALFGRGG